MENTQDIKTIRLYGKLSKFGREHKFVCNNTADAIRALCQMIPGFYQELMASKDNGVGYACFLGKKNIDETQLHHSAGDNEIRIAPIVIGNGRGGFFGLILGAVLIGAAFFTGGASIAAWGAMQTTMAVAGAALMLGGISSFLTKTPKGINGINERENGGSYNFNGIINASAQGAAVPLLYGQAIVGSVVGGADLYSEDIQG